MAPAFDPDQVQPASLDLRLGNIAYRVRSSFLPGPEQTVAERIRTLELHRLDLTHGAVLERGCVYLVPLLETLALPAEVSAGANPKSSTGRLDVFTRVIGDRARGFDTCRPAIMGRSISKFRRAPSRCGCAAARGSARCAFVSATRG